MKKHKGHAHFLGTRHLYCCQVIVSFDYMAQKLYYYNKTQL